MTDNQVLQQLELNFPLIIDKFTEGMRKYPTPIFQKDCLKESFQEAYDLLSYLTALKAQRARCAELVENLSHQYKIINSENYTELMNLLRP
jgi:hypothetical protein